jgi:plasmid stabilization system protein ParE
MTHKVVYAWRSRRDLESIRTYITGETKDDATADRFILRLLEACDSLGAIPERYGPYPYARKWRMMPVGNYLVFFQIRDAEVLIGHVRHSAREPLLS